MILLPGFQNTAIDTSLGLESNNSTYITRTGGTHKSNVHNANTHRSDKTYKKGTIDLDTANSHRSAGSAGGRRRATASARQTQQEVAQQAVKGGWEEQS